MRLTMRALQAATLLAVCIPALARGQTPAPTPAPAAPAPAPTSAAPAAEPATTLPETTVPPAGANAAPTAPTPSPLPTPATNPSVMRIVDPPSVTAQKLPSDYKRELLNVIGENDMVVIYVRQSWTGRDGQFHQALGFDMFRVQ